MKNILYISLALLLLASCKKKYYQHVIENTTIREAATINIGSYFIYSIDGDAAITNRFDVYAYISSGFYDFKNAAKNGPYHSYEILEYGMRSNLSDSIYFSADGHSNADSGMLKGYFSSEADTFKMNAYYIVLPFVTNSTLPLTASEGNSAYAVSYYDSLIVNGTYYPRVYEMLNKQVTGGRADTQYLHTFYSVNAGLIKYAKKKGNEAWVTGELLRSEIIRGR